MSQLHVWAVVRLLPNLQRVVVNRFRRRGDAENYANLLRRYTPDGNFIIVFDPPSELNASELSESENADSNPSF
ncbi:MAG: hypothetical protein Kow00121_00810 [Elainellaceae cyanobacterium]